MTHNGNDGDGFDFEALLRALQAPTSRRRAELLGEFFAHMVQVVRDSADDEARDYAILAMCVQGALVTEHGTADVIEAARELAEQVDGLSVIVGQHREFVDQAATRLFSELGELRERVGRLEGVCPGLEDDDDEGKA